MSTLSLIESCLTRAWRDGLRPAWQTVRRAVYRLLRQRPVDAMLRPLSVSERVLGFAGFVLVRFNRARALQAAGSLTCTTLLALVPLLTLALTVLTSLPGFRLLLPRVREFLLSQMLPDAASRVIAGYMSHFSANAGQLRLAGFVVLATAAVSAMMTVDRTFAEIWRVRARRRLPARLLTYWLLLMLGPLAVGIALTLSLSLAQAWLGLNHGMPWLARNFIRLIPWLAISTSLTVLYRWLPHRHVPLRHALLGGICAGLGFELMKGLFAWYVRHFPGYTLIYGAFAAFPIFLLWIYLSWAVVLAGAVLTASLSHWHREAWRVARDHPDQRFRDALQLLRRLMARGDAAQTLAQLQYTLGMGFEDVELALEPLVAARLVKEQELGWTASARAWRSTVGDVWLLFHRGPFFREGQHWTTREWAGDAALAALAQKLHDLPTVYLGLPLARLVEADDAVEADLTG